MIWIHLYRQMYLRDADMAMLIGLAMTAVGAAVLGKVLTEGFRQSTKTTGGIPKSQVIEIDEYEVLDDLQEQPSRWRWVRVDDSDD